jgi:HD-like signal output (HDOD) protein
VGGWIASNWKLPSQIVSVVMWHHNPEAKQWKSADEAKLVTVVALANEIANFKGLYFAKAAPDIDLMAALRKLNIEPDELLETMKGIEDEVEEFQKMLK